MRTSPTQRSAKLLRDRGYTVGITEKWNPHVGIRQDLFNFIDMIAIKSGEPPIAVQTTTSPNMAARITKIAHLDAAYVWLSTGARTHVHGWLKRPKNSKRPRDIWECRETRLDSDMLLAIRIPPVPTES